MAFFPSCFFRLGVVPPRELWDVEADSGGVSVFVRPMAISFTVQYPKEGHFAECGSRLKSGLVSSRVPEVYFAMLGLFLGSESEGKGRPGLKQFGLVDASDTCCFVWTNVLPLRFTRPAFPALLCDFVAVHCCPV